MLVCFISLLLLCGSRLFDVLFCWLVVIFVTWCIDGVWLVDDCFWCVYWWPERYWLCVLFAWLLISYSALKKWLMAVSLRFGARWWKVGGQRVDGT